MAQTFVSFLILFFFPIKYNQIQILMKLIEIKKKEIDHMYLKLF